MDGVVFESLDWADLIPRYDSAATLFYLDPPYFGGAADYGKGMFQREDFARMADMLAGIKGAFIPSINDTSEIRAIFAGFLHHQVRLTYTVGKSAPSGKAQELIISNREVRAGLL